MKRLTQENNLNPTSTLLKVEQLSVQTKDQKVLLEHLNFYLNEGKHWLLWAKVVQVNR